MSRHIHRPSWTTLSLVAGLIAAAPAFAAERTDASNQTSSALARYQQERAVCLSGQSHQDRATCLREAGAALAEARRGTLHDDQAQYGRNALLRCAPLPDEDRQACVARMHGHGSTSGSVESGAIYRELVIVEEVAP